MNYEQLSLLEITIELLKEKGEPTPILEIMEEALKLKGINDPDGVAATRLYMDITASSDFVFCGEGKWDLKANQSLDIFDRDGSSYGVATDDDVKEDEDETTVDDYDLADEDDDVKDYDYDDDDEDEDDEDNYSDEDEEDYDYDDDDDDDGDDYLDEDKYNQYMDDYEGMYDNH